MEIYLITCLESGKRYVGQTKHTTEKRWRRHVAEIAAGRKAWWAEQRRLTELRSC